jgi:glycolate oxidase iron-sulfur subunit
MDASEAANDIFPRVLEERHPDAPAGFDLDKCVHCGLCLNACPTYRELGLEMDSPRGRVYQMVQVATGQMEPGPSYREHIGLCLACRACETACPSGVPYGRLVEAARAELEGTAHYRWSTRWLRRFVFSRLLPSRTLLTLAGSMLYLYEASGLRRVIQASGLLKLLGKLGQLEGLTPAAEVPFFFRNIGKTFPAQGPRRFRVAFHAGCIQNVSFARLNEATIRVLQKNGCEVVVPRGQTCCGALQVHAGVREETRRLARTNIDALLAGDYDAIISNTAGCGSTLKEYDELLEHDPEYRDKARRFVLLFKDATAFLAGLELNQALGELKVRVTYQDSCHLAHGQKVKAAPRQLLSSIPGLELCEMPYSDTCCGSAGIYNVVESEMAAQILEHKMPHVNSTGAAVIATANPGCILQLRAGVARHGQKQRVAHVIELLDEAYRAFNARPAG